MHAADIHRHDHCHAACKCCCQAMWFFRFELPCIPSREAPTWRQDACLTSLESSFVTLQEGLRAPPARPGLQERPEAPLGARGRAHQACVQPAECNLPVHVSCPRWSRVVDSDQEGHSLHLNDWLVLGDFVSVARSKGLVQQQQDLASSSRRHGRICIFVVEVDLLFFQGGSTGTVAPTSWARQCWWALTRL